MTSSMESRVVPGNRRNDGAIDARELIQQRGFAHIRMPDDRHLDFVRLLGIG